MTGTSSTEDPLRDALRTAVRDVPVDDELYEKVAEGARRRARHRVGLTGIAAVAAIIAGVGATVVVANGNVQQPAAMANTTCPEDLENWTRGPQRPGTADVYVPDTPTSATVCSYKKPQYSLVEPVPASVLSRRGELSGTGLRELVTAFNAASEHPWRCPFQLRLHEVLVRFHYEAGPDVDIIMETSDCYSSSNGARTATVNRVDIPGFIDKPPSLPSESTTPSR